MFSLFKKKIDNTFIPEWASFFDGTEYLTFLDEIESYFKHLNIQFKIGDGHVDLHDDDFGFSNVGLVNVAQVCKQDDKKNYKEIITDHFNALIKANKFDKEFAKIADRFEDVKKYIGVRLYNNEYVDYAGKENTIGKNFAGDIFAMIVFDFPESILSIKPEQIIPWNKTVDELYEIGIANVKAKYPTTITKQGFGEFSVWFVQGEHFFAPNIVFEIENRQELIGSKGSLIGLPHRHSAIIYPIENLEVVKAINGIIPTVYGMCKEGPGSLSDNLFWYKDKKFTQLPYNVEEGKLQFIPPSSFVEILNELE